VPLSYIFRQARVRIEEKIDTASTDIQDNGKKIDTLDERVRLANGRMTKLETWSTFHQQQYVVWCADVRAELADIRKQLEGKH
jgi:hypothetical protein